MPDQPIKPLVTVKGQYSSPIRPPAPPADDEHVLLKNALARLVTKLGGDEHLAHDELLNALKRGSVRSATWSGLTFRSLPADFWVASPEDLSKRLKTSLARWFSLSEEWLFVERKSLDALLIRASKTADATPFEFEMNRDKWPLFDACVWVATKGQNTTNERIAADNLEQHGASELFERLSDQPLINGVTVHGRLPMVGTRASVPQSIWDGAHAGWGSGGYEVQFYFAVERKPGSEREFIAADLISPGGLGSSALYRELWIWRDDLFRLFPNYANSDDTDVQSSTREAAALPQPPAAPEAMAEAIRNAPRAQRAILKAAWQIWGGPWDRALQISERNAQVAKLMIASGWRGGAPNRDTFLLAFKVYDAINPE